MTAQYWVGDFFIDLTRNQITQKAQSQTMPPKALAVLTCLAKNASQVVSHDALLSAVWPNTLVTPNTLQRSIAQLRKALVVDGHQSYIKTHAKQGYSLECEIRWQDKADAESLVEQALQPKANTTVVDTIESEIERGHDTPITHIERTGASKTSRSALSLITILVGIVLLSVMGFSYLTPTHALKLSVGELRLLTTTDNKELASIYTPDGQYVVFHRYSEEFCLNNIWAKNTETQEEIQLTKNMGLYGSHSFSKDGKELVFIETENCDEPITQKKCYKLVSLDFQKALEAPQPTSVFMECKNSIIAKPKWLNSNNIALFQNFSNRWELTSYSIADNKSTVIYALEDGNLIDFDYSVKDDLIALTSIHSDGQLYIEILKPDGQVLSSHQIEYPDEIPNFAFIYPNFTPYDNQLIFSTGRQLFTLSYDGKVSNISLPLDEPIGSPIFHSDAKRMLVIKGYYDSDIATMPLAQITALQAEQNHTDQNSSYSVLERSIQEEDNALFQPNGDLIAFESERSGEEQVWITDGDGSQQLTHFPIDTNLYGMNWAADGKSILVSANKELTQVFLDSSHKSVPFVHPVERLFQWNSEDNTALLIARIRGVLKLVEFNLNNSEFSVITDKKVSWALKSEDGRLIYTDHMDRFWQPGPAEDQLIELLNNQGSDKRFVTKNNVVYGINEVFQLWSYDLNEHIFEVLGDIPKTVDHLTGINQTDILLAIRVASKKEVAELILTGNTL